jgi:hypothetical protein
MPVLLGSKPGDFYEVASNVVPVAQTTSPTMIAMRAIRAMRPQTP